MNQARTRVHEKLTPELGHIAIDEVAERAAELLAAELTGHDETLRAQAAFELAQLPNWKFTESDYQTQKDEIPDDETKFLSGNSLLVAVGWNPIYMAAAYRTALTATLGIEALARRQSLESVAPIPARALSTDLDAPAIAFVSGPEVVIVELRWDAKRRGYLPVRVRQLRRKTGR